MTTPASGTMKLSDANAEFGLGLNLRAYLGCVPGVVTSGTINLRALMNKTKLNFGDMVDFATGNLSVDSITQTMPGACTLRCNTAAAMTGGSIEIHKNGSLVGTLTTSTTQVDVAVVLSDTIKFTAKAGSAITNVATLRVFNQACMTLMASSDVDLQHPPIDP